MSVVFIVSVALFFKYYGMLIVIKPCLKQDSYGLLGRLYPK